MLSLTLIDVHIFSWLSAIIFFLIAIRRQTRSALLQRLLHAAYASIIITGTFLIIAAMNYGQPLLYAVKSFIGALIIIGMESTLIQRHAQKRTKTLLILTGLLLVIIFIIGIKLPMGYYM